MILGVTGYSIAAALYLIFAVLLLTSWRGRLQGGLLVVAVVVTSVWAGAAAYSAYLGEAEEFVYPILEGLRNAAWFAFLLRLLDPLEASDASRLRRLRYAVPVVVAGALAVVLIDIVPAAWLQGVSASLGVDLSLLGHLALALIGLVLIEQLYRNTRPERRWAVKFLFLGLGGLFAYDFYLYSDALLFKRIDVNLWVARGFVDAMVVPMLALTAARNPDWSVEVFVSRQVVFHSVTVVGAGLYLLVMAGAGYWIRLYGGSWGGVFQVVFLTLAIMLLAVLLFSGSWRARLKVFLSKHFYANKYDYREAWLRFFDTLTAGGPGDRVRSNCIRALTDIVESQDGQLWQKRADGYHCIVTWNLPVSPDVVPETSSLVQFLGSKQYLIDITEVESEPELYQGLCLPGWLCRLREVWLVVPLWREQALFGFAVLGHPTAPRRINWEDRDFLLTAGRQVASYLALIEASEALAEARQFEAFNRLSAYVVHDLKNLSAQLALVVSNAARHKDDPEFVEDAIDTIDHAVGKMRRMLDHLRKNELAPAAYARVDLAALLRDVIARRSVDRPVPVLEDPADILEVSADGERLGAVLEHLIQNAQEATEDQGLVQVRISPQDQQIIVEIEDNGCGMDARFVRERLFKPFDTTKGNAGMGIGVYEAREFIQSLGGRIDVESTPGEGTCFTLSLRAVTRRDQGKGRGESRQCGIARPDPIGF